MIEIPPLNFNWENRNPNGDVVSPTLYDFNGFQLKFFLEVNQFIYNAQIIFSIQNLKSPQNLPVFTRLIYPGYYPGLPPILTDTIFSDMILKSAEGKVNLLKGKTSIFDLRQNFEEFTKPPQKFYKPALQNAWIYCWAENKNLSINLQEIGASGSLSIIKNSPLTLRLIVSFLENNISFLRVQVTDIYFKKHNLATAKTNKFGIGTYYIDVEKYFKQIGKDISNLKCFRAVSYNSMKNQESFTGPLFPKRIYSSPFRLFSIDDGGNWIYSNKLWRGQILKK